MAIAHEISSASDCSISRPTTTRSRPHPLQDSHTAADLATLAFVQVLAHDCPALIYNCQDATAIECTVADLDIRPTRYIDQSASGYHLRDRLLSTDHLECLSSQASTVQSCSSLLARPPRTLEFAPTCSHFILLLQYTTLRTYFTPTLAYTTTIAIARYTVPNGGVEGGGPPSDC